jgi:FlaA1/EpsC-like NDP-sugar epimerase
MRLIWRRNFWLILASDFALLTLCYFGAYWLCYSAGMDAAVRNQFAVTLVPLLGCKIMCFFLFDVYRGMWRYTGINDLQNIIKASAFGSCLFIVYLAVFHYLSGVFKSVIVADALFTVLAIGGFRLFVRLCYQRDHDFMESILFWRQSEGPSRRAFIVGTGPLAERLLRELGDTKPMKYSVVGFIHENAGQKGMKIHGVPILGTLEDIPDLVVHYRIDDILIAISSMESGPIEQVVEACAGLDVRFKVIPSLMERIDASVTQNLRDIKLEDLLGRESVELNMSAVRQAIGGKTVLVTGAGGSIGSELARQILGFNPKTLILLDNSETPLYNIELELVCLGPETLVVPCITDIRSENALERVFARYKPEIVYHAAAYKHVPMMELSPLAAADNNTIGTYKVASMACKYHTKKFVMISTDKAVRPTSVMGATKRMAEMVVQSMNGNGTHFSVVRFGNVLGSNGSVVPLFEKQIASGGPVTVTHPDITRYFMTIPEAVMLVLQSGTLGRGGELFLLDMGKQVKIVDLARNMIRLAGLIPDKDIQIEYVGMRPGEKLYEELLIEGEDILDTSYDKIKICQGENGIDKDALYRALEDLKRIENDLESQNGVLDIIEGIVPRYSPSDEPVVSLPGSSRFVETKVSEGGTVDQKRRIG